MAVEELTTTERRAPAVLAGAAVITTPNPAEAQWAKAIAAVEDARVRHETFSRLYTDEVHERARAATAAGLSVIGIYGDFAEVLEEEDRNGQALYQAVFALLGTPAPSVTAVIHKLTVYRDENLDVDAERIAGLIEDLQHIVEHR